MKRSRVYVVCIVWLTAIASCAESVSSPEAFLSEQARLTCERAMRCGAAASAHDCIDYVAGDGIDYVRTIASYVRTGSVGFDVERARACIDALSEDTCRSDASATACADVFVGALPTGGSCVLDEQCQGYCDRTSYDGCDAGTCRERLAAGAMCRTTVPELELHPCAEGLWCDAADTGKCLPLGALDEPCKSYFACEANLRCIAGSCRPGPGLGEHCDVSWWQCAELGTYCDTDADRCAAKIMPGEACSGDEACTDGYSCSDGLCAAWPSRGVDGAACDIDFDCEGACDAGICVAAPVCE